MKIRYILSALLAVVSLAGLHAQQPQASTEIPLVGNIYGRQDVTSLNGKWRYIIDQQEIGFYD